MFTEFAACAARVVAGVLFGYAFASYIESAVHEHVSDARPAKVRRWKHYPRLLAPLLRAHYSHHVVHHMLTFVADHVTQFRSPENRARVDEELRAHGEHGALIRRAEYGARLGGTGAFAFIAPLIPVTILVEAIFGGWGLVGALPMLSAPPVLSHFVHPHLHRRYTDVQRDAPRWIAWFIRTSYGQAVVRNHWMHHKYRACFNLLLGADVARGVSRRASARDLATMHRIGLLRAESNEKGAEAR
jgi:hypothetical protein